jgi:hypothetical protein
MFNKNTLKLYNEIKEKRESFLLEAIIIKFRLLRPLGKLYNIIIYSRSTTTL